MKDRLFSRRLDENDVTPQEAEAFAEGVVCVLDLLGIETCSKGYDPLVIEGDIAHTYAFDLWDGGRHHQFKRVSDVVKWMKAESARLLENDELIQNQELRKRYIEEAIYATGHGSTRTEAIVEAFLKVFEKEEA